MINAIPVTKQPHFHIIIYGSLLMAIACKLAGNCFYINKIF